MEAKLLEFQKHLRFTDLEGLLARTVRVQGGRPAAVRDSARVTASTGCHVLVLIQSSNCMLFALLD
jgi:hypothetical protein